MKKTRKDSQEMKQKLMKDYEKIMEQYVEMAYMAFSHDYIDAEKLIEKALENPRCAYCWLFTVWQYVGCWRTSDIMKIPVVRLPWNREDIAAHIKGGDWHRYAVETALILEQVINSARIRPKKGWEPVLTVFFAEPLQEVIGLAYLTVYYHSSDEKIRSCRLKHLDFSNMFGEAYTKVFGDAVFGSRLAIKGRVRYFTGLSDMYMLYPETVRENTDFEERPCAEAFETEEGACLGTSTLCDTDEVLDPRYHVTGDTYPGRRDIINSVLHKDDTAARPINNHHLISNYARTHVADDRSAKRAEQET